MFTQYPDSGRQILYRLYRVCSLYRTPWNRVIIKELIGAHLLRNPSLLWNVNAYYDTHISSVIDSIPYKMNPFHSLTLCFLKTKLILILSSCLSLGLPNGLFSSGFPTKILYEFLIYSYILCGLPILFPYIPLELITLIFNEYVHIGFYLDVFLIFLFRTVEALGRQIRRQINVRLTVFN